LFRDSSVGRAGGC